MEAIKICVVCLGNICRSPLGEAAIRDAAMRSGMKIRVDSAGTGGWHQGEPPDLRSIAEARRHGMDISKQRARQFQRNDFEKFDLVLAMDEQNKRDLLSMTQDKSQQDKVHLFMHDQSEVPDPYHGKASDFAQVFEMVRTAAQMWMEHINAKQA
jgi:protein-tyrosine phosphatase